MKKFLITLPLAIATAFCALAVDANAQTVSVNGLGSSALFLEAGLGASSLTTGVINAPCVWTGNNSVAAGNVVSATDTSVPTLTLSDAGNAWVAWTTGGGSCAAPASGATIYAYLQTDSVVGDRCLFNANLPGGALCKITYPTTNPASAALLYPGNDASRTETALPTSIANALNLATVNAAGTDIRPEDAWFATKRALTPCGTVITTPNSTPPPTRVNTQYLGLGYSNGGDIQSFIGGSPFHVIDFTIPTKSGNSYAVTPVGATPILVVINGPSSGFGAASGFSDISSATLAQFLDGRLSLTNQVNGVSSGNVVNTIVREPLSGTYNTMEYNVPNRTSPAATFQTSQDVGLNQPTAQRNCNGTGVGSNPMNIASIGGGARERAIGTGQALAQVVGGNTHDTLGYGFWSVANFKPFSASTASAAKYLTVDGVDPLITTSANHTGTIPQTGSTDLANVTLANVGTNGSYPIWSLLRFVTVGSTTAPTPVTDLASAAQLFVTFGTTNARPDFITTANLKVVRSHFVPPAPDPVVANVSDGQPTPAFNGNVGAPTSHCVATEVGGDVGGVVLLLSNESTFCITQPVKTGHTNQRR